MSTVAEAAAELRKEAGDKLAEAERLDKLVATYPDIIRHVGRWKKVAYSSKSVNDKVTGVELRHNCGCCEDSPLEAWPYLETSLGRVYTDPSCFQVGQKHWICGDESYPGWKDKLRAASIPEAVLAIIQVHFDKCRQERIEAASDEPEDDE